ncbi:MAG: hypothetical protein GX800_09045 [Clostridiaceae bacterium]|nr:hypothetical protein [Clostridiaceae bacterium]
MEKGKQGQNPKQIKDFLIPFTITIIVAFLPLLCVTNGTQGEDWQTALGRGFGNALWIYLSQTIIDIIALIAIIVFFVHKKWLRAIGVFSAVLLFWLWFILFFP